MGKVIKKLREERNMSQEDLPKLTCIFNQTQISKIELGIRVLKEDEVIIFANIFKVTISKLYSYSWKVSYDLIFIW